MTTTTRERMRDMMAADPHLVFSDVDQDVFALVTIQGREWRLFAADGDEERLKWLRWRPARSRAPKPDGSVRRTTSYPCRRLAVSPQSQTSLH